MAWSDPVVSKDRRLSLRAFIQLQAQPNVISADKVGVLANCPQQN